MAPKYALWGYLTYKADVYSFGVVALEIVAGKNNMKYRPNEKFVCLLDWATVLQKKGDLMELVDPKLGSEFSKEEVLRMIKVALLCTNPSPALRPTMTAVVSMLEGKTVVDEMARDPDIYGDEWRFEALRDQFGQSLQLNSVEGQSLVQSANPTWIGSSSTSPFHFTLHSTLHSTPESSTHFKPLSSLKPAQGLRYFDLILKSVYIWITYVISGIT
ncbi:probable LRR receptor-like serine/threonine-protein kinase At1g07650 [Quercus robur]|uniref:probable LRR receptor-like serine/threonine-protein kinase At1g07650 n=1 Tax=Quercus robur TaxID=38942 RepID=UPI002161F612|nr:probable LRR receptor-like serine/threonine-protein kinase At1g07650 [Quercus robur]